MLEVHREKPCFQARVGFRVLHRSGKTPDSNCATLRKTHLHTHNPDFEDPHLLNTRSNHPERFGKRQSEPPHLRFLELFGR